MKPERYFYSVAAITMLLITLAGFHPFYIAGERLRGRKISPELFPLVLVHGAAMTAWMVLFVIQSLLISVRNRKLHVKLGWSAVVIAPVITVLGYMVAVQSVRETPMLRFWGMDYRQFLLIMLAEVTLFIVFVLAGMLNRRRPHVHRPMMLLASLSILAGATFRMPILYPIYGESGWFGMFGPIFTLGAVLLFVRSLLRHGVDRWFAVGYAATIVLYVAASKLAVSDAWSQLVKTILKT
jgi:hypothetical protein